MPIFIHILDILHENLENGFVPGPHTVDLMPVCSRAGTLLTAPSMCCMNTSQSRSNRLKANLSDTCAVKEKRNRLYFKYGVGHLKK